MIYTCTFNPSLDYIVSVDGFETGKVNRTNEELLFPGGKGINVSLVLKNLGFESTALGFMAGFTGREIVRLLTVQDVRSNFIMVEKGMSRINVKLRSDQETEINGMGPSIEQNDIDRLYGQLARLTEEDTLVLAGSIPAVMPESMYRDICERLKDVGVRIVVDATKDLLMNVLEYHPFLIKPNNHELGEIYGVTLNTKEEVVPYARRLQQRGARNVLISMAGEGALLIAEDGDVFESDPPKGKVKNSVGAGDSMVAGFIAGFEKFGSYEQAFFSGLCTGSASAFSDNLATKEEVNALLESFGKNSF
ncbi:MAG: 1-phosphofructokinase [Lachnospiraceae bacterium]|nr:1-phosphofructokinase [Lachnospiraceae bacterium]